MLHINDIHFCSKILQFILFADDTTIFLSGKNIKTLFCNINEELLKISDWFHANKLSLNTDKTKYILFHKSGSVDILPLRLPKITLDGNVIERETSSKFLGQGRNV